MEPFMPKLSKRKQKIENQKWADLNADAVSIMRETADKGLGFNCTFVDDDMKVLVGLAQRAVLAGLASDMTPDMQDRMRKAAEVYRGQHEHALGRPL